MKYPQLVSPRAVNAISDWLVSRLEQLGVESPQIYTRLLLSLLQSSVQVNDPIEFSNLEAFFANRKGGHNKRFHLPSDTETLKKLNAVQCLREIVSNEHETASIELLVGELCEKLKDIEKRSQELNEEEGFLIDTQLNIEAEVAGNSGSHHHHQSACSKQQQLCRNATVLTANDPRRLLTSENALKDLDNDPKKRYFRAFPALTKEMEDSFRVWRRNAKSLTWPVVGRSIVADNSLTSHSSSASSSISSSNFGSNINSDKVLGKQLKEDHLEEEFNAQRVRAVVDICGSSGSIVSEVQGPSSLAGASSKKKSKRRRNQALSKGKTVQNIRKITLSNSSSNPGAGGGGKFYNQHHYGHHRNTSPTWDTDFKGCWEMGPDLIKEFLSRQKISTKRIRSNSDSINHHMERNECNVDKDVSNVEEFYPGKERPTMKPYLDISFCCDEEDRQRYGNEHGECVDYFDEDYDDDNTLGSEPGLISNSGNPRRLYQREGIIQKPLVVCSVVNDKHFDENPGSEEQFDFASLKAKFNSSVEALWKDAEPQTAGDAINSKRSNANGISSAFYATTSLNALAPFKHDLWNFWSNYNQHHYDPASTSSMITTCLDDSSASSGAGAGADIANSSDYFSMPSNLDDFDKSVGAVRRHNEAGASLGAHTPSINVFLQNSIWSSSGDCVDAAAAAAVAAAAGESDESFLYKVWHSNKKLSQIDVGNYKDELIPTMFRDAEGLVGFNKPMEPLINSGAQLDFPPFNSLKWSEGINAGPSYNSMLSNTAAADMGMESLQMGDHRFATIGSAATVTGANWEAPVYGQNVQPDLISWCASNPMSLTEMYGSDVCDSITKEAQAEGDEMGPAVTLPNHCSTSSGFVAYARIKQCGIVQPQTKPLQQQSANASRMPKDYFHGGEEENLLTSESTHFHPIENFVDGHSFSISSALDVVEFDRSSSGYLRHESTEYMEYTRNDVYLADEEASNSNLNNFATAASCRTNERQDNAAKEKGKGLKDMFAIKFRLKRSGEIACQTNEDDFQMAAAKMADPSLPAEGTEMPMFYNKESESAKPNNNEAIIAAVTKAMAAAAKVASQRGLDASNSSLPWVPVTTGPRQSWLEYSSLGDEVDSCINKVDTEFWSMHAVEKQCHQRRLSTNTFERMVDMDRCDENSMDNSSHTLWGMCAVCNSCEYGKSLPANRMLRDELNLEADEIMSDLRYMQDLYIGEGEDCCSDNADFDRNSEILNVTGGQEDNLPINAETKVVDHVQATMIQKVNQLIEDLLRPEQTGKLIKMACDVEPEEEDHVKNFWSLSNVNHSTTVCNDAQSWSYGNEQLANIWQHKSENMKRLERSETDSEDDRKNAFMKPMKLLRQVGGSMNEEQVYMDNHNWEHEHLAKIWRQNASTPPKASIFGQNDKEENNESDKEKSIVLEKPANVESQEIEEKKNFKNLQCITHTPPSSNILATATYKRVQQFLNTSAAKLKLAANRKRRHSASQNFYHQQQQLTLGNNNNNNDNITDMNRFEQKIATNAATEQFSLTQEPKQTFITCKYWTTTTNGTQASLESAAAAMMLLAAATNSRTDGLVAAPVNYDDTNDKGVMLEENAFDNNFPCLIDKNASILKHVAMMSRPLTR